MWPYRPLALLAVHAACAAATTAQGPGEASGKRTISCSEQDAILVLERSAKLLESRFSEAASNLALIRSLFVAQNARGGDAQPVLRGDMCCCDSLDWRSLGRSSPWAGYHNCAENRTTELFFGNASIDNVAGVFRGNRTIDTDLAWLSPSSTDFQSVVDSARNNLSDDGFYSALWARTSGEVWSYYPSFSRSWPGHSLGDRLGGAYDGRGDPVIRATLPESNPERRTIWTQPYVEGPSSGLAISVAMPMYFTGVFGGHDFRDEFVGTLGANLLVDAVVSSLDGLRPTPGSMPMILDEFGCIVAAPPDVVQALFGKAMTLAQVRQADPCSVTARGDLKALFREVQAAPTEEGRAVEGVNVARSGRLLPHTAVYYRWTGGATPKWTCLVLVPESELRSTFRWSLPASLDVSINAAYRITFKADFVLENTGLVNMTYRLKAVPSWVTVIQPGNTSSGLGGPVALPAGGQVHYVIEYDMSATPKGSSLSGQMEWDFADDGYPDCHADGDGYLEVNIRNIDGLKEWLMLALIFGGCFLGAIILWILVRAIWLRREELIRLREERDQQEEIQLKTADGLLNDMAIPIHLLSISEFLALERLTKHEVLRSDRKLSIIDSVKALREVFFIFFSHQWTAWAEPDITNDHFQLMCRTASQLAGHLRRDTQDSFVWVDYCCIPQDHAGMQQMSILSLPVYASLASIFVVVAPVVQHVDTMETCSLASYGTRAWCRAEQMSHFATHGFDSMYSATEKGISPLDPDLTISSLHIFKGELTCCRLLHANMEQCDKERLVLPVLGVYSRLLRTLRSGAHETWPDDARESFVEVMRTIEADEDDFFPSDFKFETEYGFERRELFGSLVRKLKARIPTIAQSGDDDDKALARASSKMIHWTTELKLSLGNDQGYSPSRSWLAHKRFSVVSEMNSQGSSGGVVTCLPCTDGSDIELGHTNSEEGEGEATN